VGEDVTGDWKKLHYEVLHNLYCSIINIKTGGEIGGACER